MTVRADRLNVLPHCPQLRSHRSRSNVIVVNPTHPPAALHALDIAVLAVFAINPCADPPIHTLPLRGLGPSGFGGWAERPFAVNAGHASLHRSMMAVARSRAALGNDRGPTFLNDQSIREATSIRANFMALRFDRHDVHAAKPVPACVTAQNVSSSRLTCTKNGPYI